MHKIRKNLGELALAALQLLQKIQHQTKGTIQKMKGPGDIATEADLEAQEFIVKRLQEDFPGIPVLAEEDLKERDPADQLFIVDPLDGTTNYYRGHSHYSVAIALVEKGDPLVAAAAVGERMEEFTAIRGAGAYLNGERVHTVPKALGALSMVTLQSNYENGKIPSYVPWLYMNGGKIRNYGSAVSHLCNIASQRIDLCVLEKSKTWDFVAPGLIVLEAGGALTDLNGKALFPLPTENRNWVVQSYGLIASNGQAHLALPEQKHYLKDIT